MRTAGPSLPCALFSRTLASALPGGTGFCSNLGSDLHSDLGSDLCADLRSDLCADLGSSRRHFRGPGGDRASRRRTLLIPVWPRGRLETAQEEEEAGKEAAPGPCPGKVQVAPQAAA